MGPRSGPDDARVRAGDRQNDGRRRRVAFLVNGATGSAMSERAEAFARRLEGDWTISLTRRHGGRVASGRLMQLALKREQPDIVYVFDLAVSGVAAAMWHQIRTGVPFVIDTGDAITALARQSGTRGPLAIAATAALERSALATAAACRRPGVRACRMDGSQGGCRHRHPGWC